MPSDAEALRFVRRALRNARRFFRESDSAGEVLERWLDRQIKRKTATSRPQAEKIVPLWEDYRDKVKALEGAIADFLNVSLDPIWAPK